MSTQLVVLLVFFILVSLLITIWAGGVKTKEEIKKDLFVQLLDKVILGILAALFIFYIQNKISTAQRDKEQREERVHEKISIATNYTRIQTEIIINERKEFLDLWIRYSRALDNIEKWGYRSHNRTNDGFDNSSWDFNSFFYRDAFRENMTAEQKKLFCSKLNDLHKFAKKYKVNDHDDKKKFEMKRKAFSEVINEAFEVYRNVTIKTLIRECGKAKEIINNSKR